MGGAGASYGVTVIFAAAAHAMPALSRFGGSTITLVMDVTGPPPGLVCWAVILSPYFSGRRALSRKIASVSEYLRT